MTKADKERTESEKSAELSRSEHEEAAKSIDDDGIINEALTVVKPDIAGSVPLKEPARFALIAAISDKFNVSRELAEQWLVAEFSEAVL